MATPPSRTLTGQVGIAHRVWLELLNRTLELESKARDRDARLELLRYQVQELQALQLKPGEIDALAEERARLANRGKLARGLPRRALAQLYENENSSAHAGVSRALSTLRALAALDAEARRRAADARRGLDPGARGGARARALPREPRPRRGAPGGGRAAPGRDRGAGAQAPRDAGGAARARHGSCAPSSSRSSARSWTSRCCASELAAALQGYREQAQELSGKRMAAARALARDISARMQTLGMAGGRFEADVTQDGNAEPAQHGIDQIEFRVTANPGQPPRALAKVASGGELSRLSLAVQVSCAQEEARCMVFDEVDAGIGGAVAEIVGRELRALGARGQVLCVTHLPQVASQAHHHLRVTKLTDGRTTRTTLTELSRDERVEELARMLGGVEVTTKAREHARDMLGAAEPRGLPAAPGADERSPGGRAPT